MSESIHKLDAKGWQPYLPPGRHGLMPWHVRKSWFWGLMALLVAVLTTIAWGVPYIESRLDRLTRANLLDAGIDASTLNLRWDYRNLTVNGELPANTSAEKLTAILTRGMDATSPLFATGIRYLQIDVKPSAVVEPAIIRALNDTEFAVSARVENNSAVLDGMVETRQQRHALVNALLDSGVESIADNLEILSEDNSAVGTDTKVDVLAEMLTYAGPDNVVSVVASLDNTALNYQVSAKHPQAASEIENAAAVAMVDFDVNGKINFVRGGAVDVMASSDGSTITLSGQVLSEEQKRRLSFAANEAMGSASRVVEELEITRQPASIVGTNDRIDALAEVIASLTPGVSGEVQMRGTQLSLNAVVDSEQEKAGLEQVMTSLRSTGLEIKKSVMVAHSGQLDNKLDLQQRLDSLTEEIRKNVVFSSGNATLSTNAKSTLDRVVAVIKLYPELQVEVEGHTDNVGRDAINARLSQKRANSVKDYLVSQSVPADRLVAVGYGHRRPIESNQSPEGRRQNRRVHFNVVDNS